MYVISTRIACRLIDVAATRKVDIDGVLREVGITRALLDDVDGSVDAERYLMLWRVLVGRTDPRFPLEVAQHAHATHNLLRSVCGTCATVGAGLQRASQYLRVLTNSVAWPLIPAEDSLSLVVERPLAARLEHRYADVFGLAEVVQIARMFSQTPWKPREVRFAHEPDGQADALRSFFEAEVIFGAARTEMRIDLASLATPLQQADEAAMLHFQADAEQKLDEGAHPLTQTVATAIRRSLFSGDATIEYVAKQLGYSSRTLRRRLAEEQTTFQLLVDRVRTSLAKHHVAERKLATVEIAFLLGFSEVSAFHRAFRRWTGMTPGEYAVLTGRRR